MARPKKDTAMEPSTSNGFAAEGTGIVSLFTKREAVAMRLLLARAQHAGPTLQADQVKDIVRIADAFAEEMGWS